MFLTSLTYFGDSLRQRVCFDTNLVFARLLRHLSKQNTKFGSQRLESFFPSLDRTRVAYSSLKLRKEQSIVDDARPSLVGKRGKRQ